MDGPGHPWMSRNGRRAIRGSTDGLDLPLAPNSRHGARADACAAKEEARQLAWGRRPPPRPRRERGTEAPETPRDETPAAQQELGEEAEAEAEMEVESTPEGMEV